MPIRFHQREPACDLCLNEGLLARRVQHDDVGLQRQRGELAGIVADPQGLDRNIGVAIDRGIDRHEVILTGQLQPVARQIDHRDRTGPGAFGLLDEVAEAFA